MNVSLPSNKTSSPSVQEKEKDSSTAVAIVLPALFAIILVLLVAVAYLVPRFVTQETPASKEERRKKRLAQLETTWKAQHFFEWAAKQRDEHPEAAASTVHALCVICLDDFSSTSQIRALGCLHVFHQECLDDWFGRWNEYCPLCHRPIVEGLVTPKKPARDRETQPSVGFLV